MQSSSPSTLNLGSVNAAHDRGESDECGGGDDRRRTHPEDPGRPELRHAFAAAFFVGASAFFVMKRSLSS
jgi:hypothetical protein